jgi:glutamate-ammonia-ligase adenylyltransferase
VVQDERLRGRLLAVLGASTALADHLVRHPDGWRVLAESPAGSPSPLELRRRLVTAGGGSCRVVGRRRGARRAARGVPRLAARAGRS